MTKEKISFIHIKFFLDQDLFSLVLGIKYDYSLRK